MLDVSPRDRSGHRPGGMLTPEPEHQLVGTIDAAQSGSLILSTDEPALEAGDTIGVTKLRIGSDRFTILPTTVVSRL